LSIPQPVAVANRIFTVAGKTIECYSSPTQGSYGDGGLAVNAHLLGPQDVALDKEGNLYVVDGWHNTIRKITPNSMVNVFAGSYIEGYAGDGGPANEARLASPRSVAVDDNGNVYFSDGGNAVIRKVDKSGIISRFAGTGKFGYTGDGGAALNAEIGVANGIVLDSHGNLYFADITNHVVRKISSNGVITTVAGNGTAGFSGDGGLATTAQLDEPTDIAVDAANNIYIADSDNSIIRKVAANGIITTICGKPDFFGFTGDGGQAIDAILNVPTHLLIDKDGNLLISDSGNNRIRKISNGVISTFAGTGTALYYGDGPMTFAGDNGPAKAATLNRPTGMIADETGLTLCDGNHRVRKILY
jgi:sugar lactone lactonase YvrE